MGFAVDSGWLPPWRWSSEGRSHWLLGLPVVHCFAHNALPFFLLGARCSWVVDGNHDWQRLCSSTLRDSAVLPGLELFVSVRSGALAFWPKRPHCGVPLSKVGLRMYNQRVGSFV